MSALASSSFESRLRAAIRDVPGFPKPGIIFRDITPALADAAMLPAMVEALAEPFRQEQVTHVVGIESRGFILAAPVAVALGAGFVPVRKAGKLPAAVHAAEYALEYGTDRVEIHRDACDREARVLLLDDVLATGGTAAAASRLVTATGATLVGYAFLIELAGLQGRGALRDGVPIRSLLAY